MSVKTNKDFVFELMGIIHPYVLEIINENEINYESMLRQVDIFIYKITGNEDIVCRNYEAFLVNQFKKFIDTIKENLANLEVEENESSEKTNLRKYKIVGTFICSKIFKHICDIYPDKIKHLIED